MPFDDSLQELDRELRRIGSDDEDWPGLVLPGSVSLADFLILLRGIPTGARPDAIDDVMRSLPWPQSAPWDEWPDPGDRFTLADYVGALRLINFTPEKESAEEYAALPRRVPTWVFALLSLVSPELAAKVDEYREEVRRHRLAAGVSPEVAETADYELARVRTSLSETVRRAKEERTAKGSAILFRLRPGVSDEAAREFFHRTMPPDFAEYRAWLAGRGPEGICGCFFLPASIRPVEQERIERWLGEHPLVSEVRSSPVRVWEWPAAEGWTRCSLGLRSATRLRRTQRATA